MSNNHRNGSRMLINSLEPEENRIAILEDEQVEEFYIQRSSRKTLVGNIYKGQVINVIPSLQAAFIDIGLERNAFLHVSDTVPVGEKDEGTSGGSSQNRQNNYDIRDILRPGDERLVQVTRDSVGEKGPSLTMDISIPGRYLVLTPRSSGVGVSRKINDRNKRKDVRNKFKSLNPPNELGFIIRTAGVNKEPDELQGDLDYLLRLWKAVISRARSSSAPVLIYQESDLVIRTIRDIFTPDIEEVIIDSDEVFQKAQEFFESIIDNMTDRLKKYNGSEPMFDHYNVEKQLQQIFSRTVELESGGTIVMERTEALTAVDVNSGKMVRVDNPEDMALQTNLEATKEAARQLRLRDIGGVIVIDFIDMQDYKNRKKVEQKLKDEIEKDRAQISVLKMSKFCLVELAREKIRPGVRQISHKTCNVCGGSGYVKNVESMGLMTLREIRRHLSTKDTYAIHCIVENNVAGYLNNQKRHEISRIEDNHGKKIFIHGRERFNPERIEVQCKNEEGEVVERYTNDAR